VALTRIDLAVIGIRDASLTKPDKPEGHCDPAKREKQSPNTFQKYASVLIPLGKLAQNQLLCALCENFASFAVNGFQNPYFCTSNKLNN
jgi:hypothetical protein